MNSVNKPRSALLRAMDRMTESAGGVLMPTEAMQLGGPIEVYHNRELVEIVPNIIPAAMRSYILKAAYAGAAQITAWYVVPFINAVDPADSVTGANFNASLAEFTNYTEATRPLWAQDAEASQAIANAAVLAKITANTGGGTVNGILLISVATKGNNTGTVAAATRFASPRTLQATDTLEFKYTMQANLPA